MWVDKLLSIEILLGQTLGAVDPAQAFLLRGTKQTCVSIKPSNQILARGKKTRARTHLTTTKALERLTHIPFCARVEKRHDLSLFQSVAQCLQVPVGWEIPGSGRVRLARSGRQVKGDIWLARVVDWCLFMTCFEQADEASGFAECTSRPELQNRGLTKQHV